MSLTGSRRLTAHRAAQPQRRKLGAYRALRRASSNCIEKANSIKHIAGTADTAAKVRQGMVIIRILDGIAKNVYNGTPGKFAAWSAAAHVERDPKKKAPASPTP